MKRASLRTIIGLALAAACWQAQAPEALASTAELWEPVEWSYSNPSYSGDAYDVLATATFTHTPSSDQIVTELYYDGGTTWKLRFTGIRTGEWTFTTASSDPELNGRTGSVTVQANPDPDAKGFLTKQGNKFARQVGESGELEAVRFNVYMNGENFPAQVYNLTSTATINAYIADAQQYGFDTIFVHVCNSWFKFGTLRWDEHSSEDPDPQTFATLETLITTARSQGMYVQIWAWGDEARRWTPIGVGGINGTPDRRLQRYIAARLGPLPGWTMGYGFDLQEWVSEAQVGSWAEYLHDHFGWRHMLWGRGRSHAELDVKSYSGSSDGGQPFSYDDAVSKLNSDLNRPHLYEERFSYMRDGAWTMENTRRALWDYTMAGGIGAWWGFYSGGSPGAPPPYPNPEQLRTVAQFWEDRFDLDMERANSLTDGYCLRIPGSPCYVFCKENASSIQMDLSGMAGPQPAVAVDTKLDYAEIDLGTLNPTNQTWTAPYVSDWAIAVGPMGVPVPPVIEEVTPDPQTVFIGVEYTKQLTLLQGTPPVSWSVVQGPAGTQVDAAGMVSGWTPPGSDIGSTFAIEIEASNALGSDTESWEVLVKSRADFDGDDDVDQEDFGHFQACYSGSGNAAEPGCEDAALDSDEDVDHSDFGIFQSCMGGANQPPGC